ncbi:P-loop NTPase family protein [Burkholderia vietnamiensis]|uniref:hypothetical protein n=1 Tax=Burkholderia vietnamiensis TaxID=60552 RepID=UPI001CF0E62A|nr:hypothetical protein [Burkholderia vietnamiensis]MCA8228308.1 hypothetical protein [Burkholderia vietnamiensis]
MQTILVTGSTGVGKSTLLSALAAQHKMTVIDPLIEAAKTWHEPSAATCGGVVIDHVHYLEDAKTVVSAAAEWCEQHAVSLWLGEIWRGELESKGIQIPADTIELHLQRDAIDEPATPVAGQRTVGNLEQVLPLAQQIAASA